MVHALKLTYAQKLFSLCFAAFDLFDIKLAFIFCHVSKHLPFALGAKDLGCVFMYAKF